MENLCKAIATVFCAWEEFPSEISKDYITETKLPREADLIAYAIQSKKSGDTLPLTLLRDGKTVKTSFVLPTP